MLHLTYFEMRVLCPFNDTTIFFSPSLLGFMQLSVFYVNVILRNSQCLVCWFENFNEYKSNIPRTEYI
jgi:hypothetical protein